MTSDRHHTFYQLLLVVFAIAARESLVHAESCGQWAVAPNPVFDGTEFRPSLIAAFAPDSAVALGGPPGAGGLIRSTWDGDSWTPSAPEQLDLPNGWNARAISGTGPNDLWVSGLHTVDNFHGQPFLAHFDGQQWDADVGLLLPDPTPDAGDPARSGEGSAIAVIAPDDIWVVGYGDSPNGSSSSPVTFHWDGSNLEEFVPQIQPVFGRNNNTKAVAAAAGDYVWIVGYGRNVATPDPYFHLYTYRFDGSSWIPELDWAPLPGPAPFQEHLEDVVAFAPDDAWAVGNKLVVVGGVTESLSFYLHWDGAGWTEVVGPDIGPITSAAGSGADDIWVSNAYGEYGGRLAHWDGLTWTEVNSAPLPNATHIGLTNLSAGLFGDVWAVGYWAVYNGMGGWDVYENILEQFVPGCAVAGDIDGDGILDVTDVALFTGVLTGADTNSSHRSASDLNVDGEANGADIVVFVNAFLN